MKKVLLFSYLIQGLVFCAQEESDQVQEETRNITETIFYQHIPYTNNACRPVVKFPLESRPGQCFFYHYKSGCLQIGIEDGVQQPFQGLDGKRIPDGNPFTQSGIVAVTQGDDPELINVTPEGDQETIIKVKALYETFRDDQSITEHEQQIRMNFDQMIEHLCIYRFYKSGVNSVVIAPSDNAMMVSLYSPLGLEHEARAYQYGQEMRFFLRRSDSSNKWKKIDYSLVTGHLGERVGEFVFDQSGRYGLIHHRSDGVNLFDTETGEQTQLFGATNRVISDDPITCGGVALFYYLNPEKTIYKIDASKKTYEPFLDVSLQGIFHSLSLSSDAKYLFYTLTGRGTCVSLIDTENKSLETLQCESGHWRNASILVPKGVCYDDETDLLLVPVSTRDSLGCFKKQRERLFPPK